MYKAQDAMSCIDHHGMGDSAKSHRFGKALVSELLRKRAFSMKPSDILIALC
jgi:hypothetical protein